VSKQVVKMPGFVPVRVEPAGLPREAAHARLEVTPAADGCRGRIEIEMCGARIRVEPGVDAATLLRVLSAVRGAQ